MVCLHIELGLIEACNNLCFWGSLKYVAKYRFQVKMDEGSRKQNSSAEAAKLTWLQSASMENPASEGQQALVQCNKHI